jgi:serine/threonine protein kinase
MEGRKLVEPRAASFSRKSRNSVHRESSFAFSPKSNGISTTKKEKENSLKELSYLFLVVEYHKSDLKKTMAAGTYITEDHIVIMMYNALCSINFMHSANIMHRDIKPANLLIDDTCSVKICDFGLSRDIPLSIRQD